MNYPLYRSRRMRQKEGLRRLVRETFLSKDNLIMPLFVKEGLKGKSPISSMPGQYQFSLKSLVEEIKEIHHLGIPAVMLFGIPDKKDEMGSKAYDDRGIVQAAIRAVKAKVPEIILIADVCLCEYTKSGHCGVILQKQRVRQSADDVRKPKTENRKPIFEIDNDRTLELLAKTAVSYAKAGVDMAAPSAMMDGQVGAIRAALDKNGFSDIPIMSYSAKYLSALYGPFREGAESAPAFGDRSGYQMDMANSEEALREVQLDIEEGADIVMVKPALAYLDIIQRVKANFSYPVAAYCVSGEYAMVKAASEKGWIDEKRTVIEILTAIKRAGADMIITYWAKEIGKSRRAGGYLANSI